MDNTPYLPENAKPMFTRQALLKLIIPLVIEQFLAVLIGMIDTVMISTEGEAAVSAISLVDSINILLINLFSALATGGAVIVSQYLGMREKRRACDAAKQLQFLSLAISLVIATVSLLFGNTLLSVIFGKTETDVMSNCRIYFAMSALSYPFLALYNSGAALFRSMKKSKISMYVSFMMNGINVIGNALFIYVFGLGVFGAALATLIARMAGCVLINLLLLNQSNDVYIDKPFQLCIQPRLITKIFRIGIPTGLENSMFQFGKLFMSRLISTFGTSAIAANAISNTVCSLSNVPASAIGLAVITVVGQCIGAGQKEQAFRYSRKLLRAAYAVLILMNLIVILALDPLISCFSLEAESAALAKEVIFVFCIVSSLIWPLSFTLPNPMRAAGDVTFPMIVSIASMWIFRVALGYILCLNFGFNLHGVWIAMYADWICRLSFYVYRFYRKKWLNKKAV